MTIYSVRAVTRWEGDPALFLDAEGSYLVWQGGQPIMDPLANAILISLLTRPGWAGNELLPPEERIESEFERILEEGPIVPSVLAEAESEGTRALEWMVEEGVFKEVSVEVINPRSYEVEVNVRGVQPDGLDYELTIHKHGSNWQYQIADPAYERI